MGGGDYYDFVRLAPAESGGLLIVVADVEGKGAASALVMANVQATLHALVDQPRPLEKLPAKINQKMIAAGAGRRQAGEIWHGVGGLGRKRRRYALVHGRQRRPVGA